MTFSDFMEAVPPWARFVLAILITAGTTMAMVRVFHRRTLALNAKDEVAKEARKARQKAADEAAESARGAGEQAPPGFDEPPLPPEVPYLSGRVIGLTSTAFVFLLAFTFGNFWQASKAATSATQAEAADWTRATSLARQIPADQDGPAIQQALEQYRATVTQTQWPMLVDADASAAYTSLMDASLPVLAAVLKADNAGASGTPEWNAMTSAIDDMFEQGRDRIDALPNHAAPGALAVIFGLGIANLALTAIWQPSRLGANVVLMGIMGAITAMLLFIVVEASNPYVGATAVQWPLTG